MKVNEVRSYYNSLSSTYDENRFGNSYGKFIHTQERKILDASLSEGSTIDLACGTGRFMDYCTHGVDLSPDMLTQAKAKYPDKHFEEGNVLEYSTANSFQQAICFHLIMHLDKSDLAAFLNNSHQLLKDGGTLVFDVPSAERKKMKKATSGWHGNNSYTHSEVLNLLEDKWKLKKSVGIMTLPIHRIPKSMRSFFLWFDERLNRSPLKKYASYRVYVLQKLSA